MSTFSGSLQSKKKSELQEIATALDIPDSGTRDDIQTRIKLYLSQNETELSEDPRFAALFGGRGRKRSAQPQMLSMIKEDVRSVTSEETDRKRKRSHSRTRRHSPPLFNDSIARVAAEIVPEDVPLPITPAASAVKKAASVIRQDATSFLKKAREQEQTMLNEGRKRLSKQKKVMSFAPSFNPQNPDTVRHLNQILSHWVHIYALTVLTELGTIMYTSWPTRIKSGNDNFATTFILQFVALFRMHGRLLGYWLIPTLVLPLLFGMLISFNTPDQDLDPVTIAIVRVACAFAGNWSIEPNVLSPRWRQLSACVHAAFAFAEAIGVKSASIGFGEDFNT